MADRLLVKNWSKHQHYKNRRPPWIKLHRELLDDMDFCALPIQAKAVLPLLWLVASESSDGSVPSDSTLLAFRLRLQTDEVAFGVKALIDNGFLIDASGALASRLHGASPEGEGETEGEGESPYQGNVSDRDTWGFDVP